MADFNPFGPSFSPTFSTFTTMPVLPTPPRFHPTTDAVECIDGWAGQVRVSGLIVAERRGFKSRDKATSWANKRVTKRLGKAFA